MWHERRIRRIPHTHLALVALLALVVSACTAPAPGQMPVERKASEGFPQRVLVTNDNGIEDEKIHALAKAFAAAGIDTWVVAASTDRSGASNWLEATRTGEYRVRTVSIGPSIKGFMLQGTPADCVVFALSGPMRNTPPDLVVSGINGGANEADDWFGSGTIGAARTGTYFGVPGIAVSGLLSDAEPDHRRVAEWVVSFARSKPVRRLEPPQYLTVSLPEGPITDITGVEVVRRARGLVRGAAEAKVTEDGWNVWSLRIESTDLRPAPDTDVAALERKHIAIVPMRVDEMDEAALRELRAQDFPAWPALPTSASR